MYTHTNEAFITAVLLVPPPSLQLGFLYHKNPSEPLGIVAGIKSQSTDIINSAFIGNLDLVFMGKRRHMPSSILKVWVSLILRPPMIKVISNLITAAPPFQKREACLTAKDQLGRMSSPVCLPPFPVNYNVSIGQVIMPPTVFSG